MLVIGAAAVAAPSKAFASGSEAADDVPPREVEPPWWREHLRAEVALKTGWGLTNLGTRGSELVGPNVGVRGGLSLYHAYLGASVMFAAPRGGVDDTGRGVGLFGGETGYDIEIGIVTIRPTIGMGAYVLWSTFPEGNGTHSDGAFYVEPGLLVEVTLGHVVVGADANALLLPWLQGPAKLIGQNVAFTPHVQVGFVL
jgi:hypothetical protein